MEMSARETKPYSWRIYDVLSVMFVIGFIGIFGPVGMVVSAALGIIYSVALPLRYYEITSAGRSKAAGK